MNNPWISYDYTQTNQVHPLDQEAFAAFNAKIEKSKSKTAFKLKLSETNTALPYFGSLDAKLVILAANPGLDPVKTPEEETPELRQLFALARRHELTDHPFVFLRSEFKGTAGYDWWESRTKQLRAVIGDERFLNHTFSAEIHPYKSQNYRKLTTAMPTQQYTFDCVDRLVRSGAHVILVRAKKEWRDAVPSLISSSKVVELNSAQSSYLTTKNMKPGVFDALVRNFR